MYPEQGEDPIRRQVRKIIDLTFQIFSHYKNTNQKAKAYNLLVWVVSALQAILELKQRIYIVKPFTPETVRLAYMRAKSNASNRCYITSEAP